VNVAVALFTLGAAETYPNPKCYPIPSFATEHGRKGRHPQVRENSEKRTKAKRTSRDPALGTELVRQRTIPAERPPLVGEVSANFSG
jgi:hypothetical protein